MTATRARTDSWVTEHFGVRIHAGPSAVGWAPADLVGLALRRNPRRAHLLVSTVLGKHIPVAPDVVLGTGRLLGLLVARSLGDLALADVRAAADALRAERTAAVDELVRRHRPSVDTIVFGFAETATGLGHCVADALHARAYLHSTRREVAGVPVALRFEEGHSHATAHLVQPSPADVLTGGDVLVLVDDELSTGTTAMAAIRALQQVSPRRRYVVAALIDLRGPADTARLDAFATAEGLEITVVALASGSVDLPAELAAAAAAHIAARPAAEPRFAVPAHQRVLLPWPAGLPEGGRHGVFGTEGPAFDAAVTTAAAVLAAALPGDAHRVLVVGTEEFMYLPLRLAAALTAGRDVRFQTTTRSPVHPEAEVGYPVRRAFRFAAPEPDADGVPRYLYNAGWDDGGEADAVVVVVDAAADTPALAAPDGPCASLAALGVPVLVAVVPGGDPQLLGARR